MSSMAEAFSDFIVSFILLAMGSGWTLGSHGNSGSGLGNMYHPFDPKNAGGR